MTDPGAESGGRSTLAGWRHLGWIAWGEAAGRLLVFIAHALAARRIGPESFGIAATAYVTAGAIWLVANWGGDLLGIRRLSSNEDRVLRLEVVRGRIFAGALGGGATFALTVAGGLGGADVGFAAGAYVLGVCLYPDWVMRGTGEFRNLAGMSLLLGLLMVAGVWLLVPSGAGAARFLVVVAVAYPVAALPYFSTLRSTLLPLAMPRWSAWLRVLSAARRLGASQVIATGLQLAPLWAVLFFVGPVAAGIFAAAARLVQIAGTATFMLGMAFFSDFSGAEGSEVVTRGLWLAGLSAVVGATFAGVAALLAPVLVVYVFGPDYEGAVQLFRVLTIAIALLFLRNPLRLALIASGNDRVENNAMLAGSAANLLLALTMTPYVGVWGGVAAVVAGEVVLSAGLVLGLTRVGYAR